MTFDPSKKGGKVEPSNPTMWTVAERDEEIAEEGSSLSHMETFLERGILRNKKTFSAVFERIFLKVFYDKAKKLPPVLYISLSVAHAVRERVP